MHVFLPSGLFATHPQLEFDLSPSPLCARPWFTVVVSVLSIPHSFLPRLVGPRAHAYTFILVHPHLSLHHDALLLQASPSFLFMDACTPLPPTMTHHDAFYKRESLTLLLFFVHVHGLLWLCLLFCLVLYSLPIFLDVLFFHHSGLQHIKPGDYWFIRDIYGDGDPLKDYFFGNNVDVL